MRSLLQPLVCTSAILLMADPGLAIAQDTLEFKKLREFTHYSDVNTVAISPDGKRILSGCNTSYTSPGNAKVWDAETGKELLTLDGHKTGPSYAAFSPDGKWIVTGSWDKVLDVWDAKSGQKLRTLKGPRCAVFCVAVSPSGKHIVSGSGYWWGENRPKGNLGEVCVWEASSGKLLWSVEADADVVHGVAVSYDGKRVASAGWDRNVVLWDMESGKKLQTLAGHRMEKSSNAWAVAFSPDGKRIATGSNGERGTVRLWDAETGQELHTIKCPGGHVRAVVFSPDSKWLATGRFDGTVSILDVETGRESVSWRNKNFYKVSALAWSITGTRLVEGSDIQVTLWELRK